MNRDLGVTRYLREVLPEWLIDPFVLLALLGDLVVIVPLVGAVYLADVLSSRRHKPDTDRTGDEPLCSPETVSLIAIIFGGLALVVVVKAAVALPRPPAALHAVEASAYGFPSGHVLAATIVWGTLAIWWPFDRLKSRVRARIVFAGAIVVLVSVSRLVLGVHFLPDVVVSILLGVGYLGLVGRLTHGRPAHAFAVAILIAIFAMMIAGTSDRAVLALLGTVGALAGWILTEHPPVRRHLRSLLARIPSLA